ITFAELAAEYLTDHGPVMAENSCERAGETLRLHLLPVFGHMLVDSIKAHHVGRWQRARLAAGAKPATVNREWSVMKAVLNFGEAKELIERNPIRRGAVKLLKADNMRTAFFEPEEWRAFITAFDDPEAWRLYLSRLRGNAVPRLTLVGQSVGIGSRRPDSDASSELLKRLRQTVPLFRTLFYTASRLSEILTLTWSAVDLKRDVI